MNGCGIATAAVAAALLRGPDAAPCAGSTLTHNTSSQRVLGRNGFTYIGTAPQHLRIAEDWQDHYLYQRIKSSGAGSPPAAGLAFNDWAPCRELCWTAFMTSGADHHETQDPDAVPGLAPPPPAPVSGQILVVDGEQFVLREHLRQYRVYSYDWLTGPNPGYGFSSSSEQVQHLDDHITAIRSFLSDIDPDTGYLGDVQPNSGPQPSPLTRPAVSTPAAP